MIDERIYNIIQANADALNSAIIYDRDFTYVSSSNLIFDLLADLDYIQRTILALRLSKDPIC